MAAVRSPQERLIKLNEAQPQTKWRVEVIVDGERVLSIEDDSLCGNEFFTEEQEDAIRAAGQNLLAFIGEKKEPEHTDEIPF